MEFCPKCNNMMYPRENRAERKLEYHCKNCNQVEDARSTLVFTNNITTKNEAVDITINPNMIVDPTLPRSFEACCPKCTYNEAVYFTNPNKGEESMALTFMCCRPHCGKMWDQVSDEKK